jgi:phage portal protein BeeE
VSFLDLFRRKPEIEVRDASLSLDAYIELLSTMSYNGVTYTLPSATQEAIGGDYNSLVRAAYKSSPIVFACMERRAALFSEARFQFRRLKDGRPGNLFGSTALDLLENPWPGGTTGDLLKRMIQYADLGGNAFVANRGAELMLLRPDWTTILIGSFDDPEVAAWDVNAELMGYVYQPGGNGSGRDPVYFLPEQVAHFAPIPDPEARLRGMSWLTPVIREIMADKAATAHKQKFFENGAVPNMIVKFPVSDIAQFSAWMEKFKEDHEGVANKYKTLFLAAGMDATVVGANMEQIEFSTTQGAGETRIAAAAGVPPIIAGFAEGLKAATYSNYGQARRAFADATLRPLWRNAAGSLARITRVPNGAELWYDDRDISFLQEDRRDAAEIQGAEAATIRQLVDAGYKPESVVEAVLAEDWALLEHSKLFSVQLQEPGSGVPPVSSDSPPENGAPPRAIELDLLNRLLDPSQEAPTDHVR